MDRIQAYKLVRIKNFEHEVMEEQSFHRLKDKHFALTLVGIPQLEIRGPKFEVLVQKCCCPEILEFCTKQCMTHLIIGYCSFGWKGRDFKLCFTLTILVLDILVLHAFTSPICMIWQVLFFSSNHILMILTTVHWIYKYLTTWSDWVALILITAS